MDSARPLHSATSLAFFVGDATTTRLSLALSGAFLLNLVGVMVSGAVVKRESDTFFND